MIRGCLYPVKNFINFLRNYEYHLYRCNPSFWYLISYLKRCKNSPYSAGEPSFDCRKTSLWWQNQTRFYHYSKLIADWACQHSVEMIIIFIYCICSWFIRFALFQGLLCEIVWRFKAKVLILMRLKSFYNWNRLHFQAC